METLIKRSFFVLAATLTTMTSLRAQTADDIINKYVAAVGGKDVLDGVKSLIIETDMQVMGQDLEDTITVDVGKGYKSEANFNGMQIVNCANATGGWVVNPQNASPTAMPEEQYSGYKLNLWVDVLAYYAANGYKVEYTGKDSSDYKIKMTGNGADVTYYINTNTNLLDKEVSHLSVQGQEVESTLSFSDYRKLDNGLMFPYTENIELPQITLALTVKKITINPTIDPTIFDMPKQ